ILYDAFGQRQISTIFTQRNQYHVILEVLPELNLRPNALDNIYIDNRLTHTSNATNAVSASNLNGQTTAKANPTPANINALYTTSAPVITNTNYTNTQAIPLNTITTISQRSGPLVIHRQGQFPVSTISFNLAPDAALGEAVNVIEKIKAELRIPASVQINFE